MTGVPSPTERRTWPGLGVGVFLVLGAIAFGTSGPFGFAWLVPITPLALGAWRWGPKGILFMIPVAILVGGVCVAIVLSQIEI